MDGKSSDAGHIDFVAWLFRIVSWDGVLPACLFLVPLATKLLFPNQGWAFAFVAVALPIAGLFIRIRAGCHHIDANNCGPLLQKLQVCLLLLGVFLLVFIDAFLILIHEIGWGAMLAARGDVIVVATVGSIYLTVMAMAMYPGRSKPFPAIFLPEVR